MKEKNILMLKDTIVQRHVHHDSIFTEITACRILNQKAVLELEHFRAMPLGRVQQLQQHEILKRIVGIFQSVILSVTDDIINHQMERAV